MKIIIAGTRHIYNPKMIEDAVLESGVKITQLVCGMCAGVDQAAYDWAIENGIEAIKYQADWDSFGCAAGPIRNSMMAEVSDGLILLDAGGSGSQDMYIKAKRERDKRRFFIFHKDVSSELSKAVSVNKSLR